MIKFTKKEDGEQFVSIMVCDGTSTKEVADYICGVYPTITGNIYKRDNDEILLNLFYSAENPYNFSLNDLRQTVNKKCFANVRHFVVDLKSQREYA